MTSQVPASSVLARGDDAEGDVGRAHFVFVPLREQGHLIPAVDTALLLAAHGAVCTIVAPPSTAALVRRTVEPAQRSGLPVRLAEFPLDYAESGLPEGADNGDSIPPELMWSYYRAMALLRAPIERHLGAHAPYPTCVVSDFIHPWTTELAANLGVPRLTFFSMCAFGLLCQHNLERFHAFDGVDDPNAPVVVPGLDKERRFVVTRAQAPGFFRGIPIPCWEEFADYVERARAEADGVVINTVLELEPEYVAGYAAARGMKVWTVGPVSTYQQSRTTLASTLASRGLRASAVDPDECRQWLDGRGPGSVVYVSFGSISRPGPKQVVELDLGLEASGHPFLWAVKDDGDEYDETVREFLRELEARVGATRCLLVRGWAPQLLILSHDAVGGFVTHCGWNSTLEAVTAGLPMVTWPHFTDQFLNEKMVVEVLRTGVSVGVKEPLTFQAVKKEILVARGVVEAAVRAVMGGGEEAEERRRRARALADKARAAAMVGGSSHANLAGSRPSFRAGRSTWRRHVTDVEHVCSGVLFVLYSSSSIIISASCAVGLLAFHIGINACLLLTFDLSRRLHRRRLGLRAWLMMTCLVPRICK